jgi:hypothetical protein
LKKTLALELRTKYSGTTHTLPHAANLLVSRVANRVSQELLHVPQSNRLGNNTYIPTTDTIHLGIRRLPSTTIPTFNKQLRALQQSRKQVIDPAEGFEEREEGSDEEDEIPSMGLSLEEEVSDETEHDTLAESDNTE